MVAICRLSILGWVASSFIAWTTSAATVHSINLVWSVAVSVIPQ